MSIRIYWEKGWIKNIERILSERELILRNYRLIVENIIINKIIMKYDADYNIRIILNSRYIKVGTINRITKVKQFLQFILINTYQESEIYPKYKINKIR